MKSAAAPGNSFLSLRTTTQNISGTSVIKELPYQVCNAANHGDQRPDVDRIMSGPAGAQDSNREEGIMKSILLPYLSWLLFGCFATVMVMAVRMPAQGAEELPSVVKLPQVNTQGSMSVETAIQLRRSVRHFDKSGLTLAEVGQLLWAAQGITLSAGLRAAPSAGALYPLEVDVLVSRVEGLEAGVYRYVPKDHVLVRRIPGDRRESLCSAALGQRALSEAPAVIVISAVYERTTHKYGQRGIRYVLEEAGHAAQNVCLQAVALQLGSVHIGAFQDEDVARVLQLGEEEKPLVLLPVGRTGR